MVKNPNWQEANELAILQARPRIWTRDYREQIQLAGRTGPEVGALQVQRSIITTRPPFLDVFHSLICFDLSIVVFKKVE